MADNRGGDGRRLDDMSDRDLLIRIDERTGVLKDRIDNLAPRVKWLETKVWASLGGTALIAAMVKMGLIKHGAP